MRKAFFPGTFNPPTFGHLNIIERSLGLCDRLIVGVGENSAKKALLFSVEERLEMLKKICRSLPQVEIHFFSGLSVEFAKKQEVDFMIRGVRTLTDFEDEVQMAQLNSEMTGIETFFLPVDRRFSHLKSSLIREIGCSGGSLHSFIPPEIEPFVSERLQKKMD